jgi:hypothetical protein
MCIGRMVVSFFTSTVQIFVVRTVELNNIPTTTLSEQP